MGKFLDSDEEGATKVVELLILPEPRRRVIVKVPLTYADEDIRRYIAESFQISPYAWSIMPTSAFMAEVRLPMPPSYVTWSYNEDVVRECPVQPYGTVGEVMSTLAAASGIHPQDLTKNCHDQILRTSAKMSDLLELSVTTILMDKSSQQQSATSVPRGGACAGRDGAQ